MAYAQTWWQNSWDAFDCLIAIRLTLRWLESDNESDAFQINPIDVCEDRKGLPRLYRRHCTALTPSSDVRLGYTNTATFDNHPPKLGARASPTSCPCTWSPGDLIAFPQSTTTLHCPRPRQRLLLPSFPPPHSARGREVAFIAPPPSGAAVARLSPLRDTPALSYSTTRCPEPLITITTYTTLLHGSSVLPDTLSSECLATRFCRSWTSSVHLTSEARTLALLSPRPQSITTGEARRMK